jgi:CBS domain containing-hemolysin-like protein
MIELFFTLLLVALNGFFVAAEFAIVKVRSSQIELHIKKKRSGAKLAKTIVDNLDGYLAATQLGITLASLGLGWIGEPIVSKLLIKLFGLMHLNLDPETAHDIALPLGFALITILHIVFGELAPKSIAIQRSESTTLLLARPLRLFYVIFKPFIWILNNIANVMLRVLGIKAAHGSEVHSSEELKFLVKQGAETGVIEEGNYDIIRNAFEFSQRVARQVMVPRTQVVGIDLNEFNDDILEKVIEEGYSRIPCFEDNLDNALGVVYLKDLLMRIKKDEPINIREMMRPVMLVPESKKIGTLLKEFQLKHQQLAIVLNEFGGTKGIVTMEDILEELVGEIQDEYDNEIPVIEKISERLYHALGTAPIVELNKILPDPINHHISDNLAGFLIEQSGRIPNTNEKISAGGYEFTILKKNRNMLVLVQIKKIQLTD